MDKQSSQAGFHFRIELERRSLPDRSAAQTDICHYLGVTMKVKLVIAALFCVIMLLLVSCDDMGPYTVVTTSSVNTDGSNFTSSDNRLFSESWGSPIYISEDLVLHIGNKVYSRALGANNYNVRQLIPDNLQVTDKVHYDLDLEAQKLYVVVSNHVYSLKFDGSQLTDLGPSEEDRLEPGIITCPVLSEDGNFLTALKDDRIIRLNLQSGVWQGAPVLSKVDYAVYISETDSYFYYTKGSTTYSKALWTMDASSTDSTMIMDMSYTYSYHNSFKLTPGVSQDRRYMVLYGKTGALGDLKLYDRLTGEINTIPAVYAYSFSLMGNKLYYSRHYKGMADLHLLDLNSWTDALIWDGYINQTSYSGYVSDITPRSDDKHVFFHSSKAPLSGSGYKIITGL